MRTMASRSIRFILFLVIIEIIFIDFKVILAGRGTVVSDLDDENFQFLIAGGFLPPKSVYAKFMVSVRTTRHIEYWGDNHFCAGVIVGNKHILTAAHCVLDAYTVALRPDRLRIVAGTPQRLEAPADRLVMEIDKIHTHPDFVRFKSSDIALLILRNAIPANNQFIQAITVPLENLTDTARCVTLGWGQVFPEGPYANELMYLDVKIIDHHACHDEFDDYDETGNICTKSEVEDADICPGDTGGPLICDEHLVGILAGSSLCSGNRPIKFTSVEYFSDWIEEIYRSTAASNTLEGVVILSANFVLLALHR